MTRATHRWLAGFIGANALAAWGGAISLMTGVIDMGDTLNHRLPFDSPVLGGAALALIVAGPMTVLTYDAWRGDDVTPRVAAMTGAALVGWIVVQYAFIRAFSAFQPFYLCVGAGLLVWSRHQPRSTAALS